MFTPTPDYLCDFEYAPGYNIPAKLKAFHKIGYDQNKEDEKLQKIRRCLEYNKLDQITPMVQDLGIKNLPDFNEYDEIQKIDRKQAKHFEALTKIKEKKKK